MRTVTTFQDLIDSRGVTHAELAERSGVSVRTIYQLRRGLVASPNPVTIRRLATALKVSPAKLREALR